MLSTLLIFILFCVYLLFRVRSAVLHQRDIILNFEHRVHVNGIRGKSSVTRLISAAMREGGIQTLGKTTGTAARLLISHDQDVIVPRKEADVAEQKRIIDTYLDSSYQALVFECMAINPIYQRYLEQKIMHSTIGVITNVREDHMDLLGDTLPEIAQSISTTIPYRGHLVTAETNKVVLSIFKRVCAERGTVMHAVKERTVGDEEMAQFRHFEYKANVAIALKVAALVGVSREIALQGMYSALADPGAFVMKDIKHEDQTIHWANLFAINDRESFELTTQILSSKVGKKTKKVVILNNRQDRPERVAQFVDVALNSVGADYIITFGDYEKQVRKEAQKYQHLQHVPIIQLGNSSKFKHANGAELLEQIAKEVDESNFILFGAVNIHSRQSQSLLKAMGENYAH